MPEITMKKCNSKHHTGNRWLPLTREYFYTQGKGKRGQIRWAQNCKECSRIERRKRYHSKAKKDKWKHKNAYARARRAALTRLSLLVPELYDRVLAEELEKEGVPYKRRFDSRHYKSVTIDTKREGPSP